MKHLFITVGTGGEKNPVHEAIAFSVRSLNPTSVTFLCSAKTKKETMPLVLDLLGKNRAPFKIHICAAEDDIGQLTREYTSLLEDAGAIGVEIHADFTSGTKPMSSALAIAALINNARGIHYAVGPRDKSGRATMTDRLLSLDTASMLAERALPEMTNLFHIGAFEAVSAWARRTARALDHGRLHSRVESLARLSAVYAKWDRFDYDGAVHSLKQECLGRKSLPFMLDAGWKENALRKSLAHLEACRDAVRRKIPDESLVFDMIANAHRCLVARRFDDAVSRGYRAAEAIGQLLLHRNVGIAHTTKVDISVLRGKAPMAASRFDPKETSVNLDRNRTLAVLREFGVEAGVQLANDRRLEDALNGRNESLLAHGFTAVTEDNARRLLDRLEKHVKITDGDRKATEFPRCPWADLKLNPWSELSLG